MRYPDYFSEEDKRNVRDAIERYCTSDGKTALNWSRCRPSDQYRRADMLEKELMGVLKLLSSFERGIDKLTTELSRKNLSESNN